MRSSMLRGYSFRPIKMVYNVDMLWYLIDCVILRLTNWMKSKEEEEMNLNQFKDFACVVKLFFLLLCVVVIDMSVDAEVFAGDTSGAGLSKGEARYIHQQTNYPFLSQGGILWDGESDNLLFDGPFKYQLSQNDKGEESQEKVNQEEDVVKDESGDKRDGSGVIFEPIQYCQGRFKRLGGTGVEIITIRCPKVDDSCNCEADKKSPTKWIECGGSRKDSTIGSDLLSCESKIVGSGAAASSE
jgi:hypothetical protein